MRKIILIAALLGACVSGDGTVSFPEPHFGHTYSCSLQENEACRVRVPSPTCTDDPGALEQVIDEDCLAHGCACVFDCTHHDLLPCLL